MSDDVRPEAKPQTHEPDVVALLLGDTLPPERLGALLRAGRKRRGWKRKHVATIAHISPDELRAYENGEAAIPPDVCARLAEIYGEHLTAHVPMRVAPPITQGDPDEVIKQYLALVRRLRGARPGDAFPLRADDLSALSATLEMDAATLEQRIVDALGCTHEEARSLHRELLARKLVLPVAGLAVGLAAFAGVHATSAAAAPDNTPTRPPAPIVAPTTTEITVAPTTTVAPPVFTPASTAASTPTTVAGRVPEIINNVVEHRPAPSAPDTSPVTSAPRPAPTHTTPPSIPEDDTPVGVLPGETPHPPPAGS